MKPISTYVHGMMDYLSGALMLVLPFMLGWDDMARTVMLVAGVAILGLSLITRYELSIVKAVSMRVHLGMDFMMGILLAITPLLFITEDTSAKTMLFVLFGAAEIGAALMTEPQSAYSRSPVSGVA